VERIEVVHASQAQESQLKNSEQLQTHDLGGEGRKRQQTIAGVLDNIYDGVNCVLSGADISLSELERYSIDGLANSEGHWIERHLESFGKTH
jgi:hypothetical protein